MIIRVSLKNRHSLNGTLISSRRLFHNFDAEEKNVRFKPSIQVLGGQDRFCAWCQRHRTRKSSISIRKCYTKSPHPSFPPKLCPLGINF